MSEERRRPGRDRILAYGPLALSRGSEGWVFVALCLVGLGLVFLGDLHTQPGGSVGALAFIPVVAAGWATSRTQTAVVSTAAIAYRVAAITLGALPFTTGAAEVLTIPILALLSHLAAEWVTAATSIERSLHRAQAEGTRLAALEGAKSEFLRLASHELRGPVGVVGGYVSMLDDGSLGELPSGARRVMPILVSKLRAISLMIDQMLETARLEDERLVLHVRRTDLGQLLTDCVEDMRPLAEPDHHLDLELPPEPVLAPADGGRVKMIVTNLIDNAVKYSPEGGPVRCKLAKDRGRAVVEVSDVGIGIAPEHRDRLFKRFSRIESHATMQIPGTGLGLYVSRELARLHGGDLNVDSCPGEGSTFVLDLPLNGD